MIKVPENVKIFDTKTSTFWFDEDGILYSISKKVKPQSLEETKQLLEEFRSIIGNKKVCMLLDVTNSSESTREVRDYAAEEFPKLVKAIAMVSESALGKMLANLFFRIKTQPYPTKMFNNEQEAKDWLMQYL
jgi:stage II sporulation SpoAA-like protein